MREGLRKYRKSQGLTQQGMADKMGVSRQTYNYVEYGSRNGTMTFWYKLQKAFNIPDTKLGGLMRNE